MPAERAVTLFTFGAVLKRNEKGPRNEARPSDGETFSIEIRSAF